MKTLKELRASWRRAKRGDDREQTSAKAPKKTFDEEFADWAAKQQPLVQQSQRKKLK